MADLTVRDFAPGDLDQVADTLAQATRQAYTFMEWTHDDASFRWFVGDSLARWNLVRVAVTDTNVVGFACLEENQLDQLFVRPAWQRRSIGRRLLDDIKRLRPDGFMLYTFQANHAARRFYESQGLVAGALGVSEAENEPDVIYAWNPHDR
jgi:ribosomal protein S18 acetylase RimI-like enzyme